MGDTRRVVDGEDDTRVQRLRPAAPLDGPLEGSGAAPDPVSAVPRPRRPWLSGRSGAATSTPAATPTAASDSGPNAGGTPAPGTPGSTTDGGNTPDETPKTEAATVADPKTEDPKAAEAKGTEGKGADAAEAEAPEAKAADTPAAEGNAAQPTTVVAAKDPAKTTVDELPVVPASGRARRRRVPFAHAVRLEPRRAATTAAYATRAWARRPSGRLTLPGVFLLALVAATAAAGALLVPATIRAPRPVAADATATATQGAPPAVPPGLPIEPLPTGPLPTGPVPTGSMPGGGLPSGGLPTGQPTVGPVIGGRPSDALAGWAQQVGAKVGVPAVAMQAYGYAELVLAQTNRSCALSWTTLAAIGQVESGHGSANGARLGQDGKALPKIIGLPLDGQGGRMRIIDTDRGELDGDRVLDRAIGPMQFIPTTWKEIGADADNDGVKDPHDLDDAALAAGNYLCKGGRNLSIASDWWNAILSYNDVRRYAQDVYNTADRYGRASR
ncbi:lytic murein transglycosylase [Micromonospora sp. WMMD967]|uniref:lytic murein transglycosylase n=1 Tax=Micromonospora sp. WMMD967 TaxID=3016101 RepID=UPI0024179501|nr:lytic murein transglycosylase [Micromonospora sp. WMMD967]MDG4835331.1 lytic murein transglycosylase [Micromonospora sp. WMMD967]